MTYTGNEDHSISLPDASTMTQRFRNTITPGATIAEYFGADAINNILAQTDCVGIRVYYGLDSANVPNLVILGVDTNGDDLYFGLLAENGKKCPPSCATGNLLNS